MIYLKNEFAPKATLLSVLGLILGFSSVIFGIMNVSSKKSADHVPGIILIVVGAVIYILLGLVLPSKLSKKEAEKNIRTKAKYGYLYCKKHPEAYEKVRSINEEFARVYTKNEAGKLVKIK